MESTRPRPSTTTQKPLAKVSSSTTLTKTINALVIESFELLQQGEIIQKEKVLLDVINKLHLEKHLDANVKNFLYACTYSILAKQTYYDNKARQCAHLEVTEDFEDEIPSYLAKSSEHLAKVKCNINEILDLYKIDKSNLATLFNIGSLFPEILIEYISKKSTIIQEYEITALIECFQRHTPACKSVIEALIAAKTEPQAIFVAVNRKPVLFLADFLEAITAQSGLVTQIDNNMLSISIELHLGKIEREAVDGNISPSSRHFLTTLMNISTALDKENFFRSDYMSEMQSADAFQTLIKSLLATKPPKALTRSSSLLFHSHTEPARSPCSKTSFIRDLSDYLYTPNTLWKKKVLKFISYTDMPEEIKAIKKILAPTRHRGNFVLPSTDVCDEMFRSITPLFEEFSRPYIGRDDRHPMVDKFFNDYSALIHVIYAAKHTRH